MTSRVVSVRYSRHLLLFAYKDRKIFFVFDLENVGLSSTRVGRYFPGRNLLTACTFRHTQNSKNEPTILILVVTIGQRLTNIYPESPTHDSRLSIVPDFNPQQRRTADGRYMHLRQHDTNCPKYINQKVVVHVAARQAALVSVFALAGHTRGDRASEHVWPHPRSDAFGNLKTTQPRVFTCSPHRVQ